MQTASFQVGPRRQVQFSRVQELLRAARHATLHHGAVFPTTNGVVERRNQTVVEMARCMLKSMSMPTFFRAKAVRTAIYLLNRAPTRSLDGVTPYEAWHGRKPAVHHLRTFGCTVHVKNIGPGITKLSDRSTPMVFVGYEEGSKAYRVHDPVSKKVRVTRDALFEENRSWAWRTPGAATYTPARATFTVVYTTEHDTQEQDNGLDSTPPTPRSPATPPSSPLGTSLSASGGKSTGSKTVSGTSAASPPATTTPSTSTPSTPARVIRWASPPSQDGDRLDVETGNVRYRCVSCIMDETEGEVVREAMEQCLLSAEEPANIVEALEDGAWKSAMDAEMDSITETAPGSCPLFPEGTRPLDSSGSTR